MTDPSCADDPHHPLNNGVVSAAVQADAIRHLVPALRSIRNQFDVDPDQAKLMILAAKLMDVYLAAYVDGYRRARIDMLSQEALL